MKSNNGKIAIAITAMFVVALSIVGFTYAYFTTRVVGNTTTESIKVDAGELLVNYKSGAMMKVDNIVPGWKNDGLTYVSTGAVTATHATETTDTNLTTYSATVKAPKKFRVENPAVNDNTNTSYYVIQLSDIVNTLDTETQNVTIADEEKQVVNADNLKITVYRTEYTTDVTATADDELGITPAMIAAGNITAEQGEVVYTGTFPRATVNTMAICDDTQAIAKGTTYVYSVIVDYEEAGYDQSDDMGATIAAKINVIGTNAAGIQTSGASALTTVNK